MSRPMSHSEWCRAQGRLAFIRQQMTMERLLDFYHLTDEPKRALEIERDPAVAGEQLESLVGKLEDHPALRQSVEQFARWLLGFQKVCD